MKKVIFQNRIKNIHDEMLESTLGLIEAAIQGEWFTEKGSYLGLHLNIKCADFPPVFDRWRVRAFDTKLRALIWFHYETEEEKSRIMRNLKAKNYQDLIGRKVRLYYTVNNISANYAGISAE